MKINGKKLAAQILKRLKQDVRKLKSRKIYPCLAVVYIGRDPASLSYIKQKQIAARLIGVKVILHHFPRIPEYQKIAEYILKLSHDPNIHGIIIQRPLPATLSAQVLNKRISLEKDVDGFLPKTTFKSPLGLAVVKILKEIYYSHIAHKSSPLHDIAKPFLSWLKSKQIVLLGRGETAGKPIAKTLSDLHLNLIIIGSNLDNTDEYLKQADIVISAVGKPNIVEYQNVKPGAIVIGVGLHLEKKRIAGDFDETHINSVASFYTPTPGGVGPVNVACLMLNLIQAGKANKR